MKSCTPFKAEDHLSYVMLSVEDEHEYSVDCLSISTLSSEEKSFVMMSQSTETQPSLEESLGSSSVPMSATNDKSRSLRTMESPVSTAHKLIVEDEELVGSEAYNDSFSKDSHKPTMKYSGKNSYSHSYFGSPGLKIKKHKRKKSEIFILLLDFKRRKFELIQVKVMIQTSTIEFLLQSIPANTLSTYLGAQNYKGFCRPMHGIELIDNLSTLSSLTDIKIISRELWIAIPEGYTGEDCMHVFAELS